MSLEKSIELLKAEGVPLSPSILYDLSNMTPSEVETFSLAWINVSVARRLSIMGKLGELTQDTAELDFTALFRCCLDDKHEEVRKLAIEGLWDYEDRLLIPHLCNLIKGDPASAVRAASALALGKFARLSQEGKLLKKDGLRILEALTDTLQNTEESVEVRRRALEAVAVFNTSQIQQFINWAYTSDNLELKCSSLYAMGKTGEHSWLSYLFKELKSSSPPIRYEAANACADIEEEEAILHLIPLTQDDDLQVQLSAVRAIGTIGGPLAKKALRRCLKLGDPAIEDATIEYLAMVDEMDDMMAFEYKS